MKTLLAAASLASVFALAPVAHADNGPTPGQEIADLKPFAGSWQCTGKTKDGKNAASKLTISAMSDLNGFWYEMKFSADKAGDMPAFAGRAYLGFDSVNSKYYLTGVDNMGGWVVLVGALTMKVLDLSGQTNMGGHATPFKFKFDASGKANTLAFAYGPNGEMSHDCRK